uniref:Radical SAM core domain-containing protein n=1 Tax=Glossina pallidipes TaxID=7398 RepID=A0A1A9Z2C5_GLOPL
MKDTNPGPWRITFDTNPDDCNLKCIMCEDHSPYSLTQPNRINSGIPKRRMDIDLIRNILFNAQGTPLREIIPSTMGEPLIYEHFDEIITLCHQYNIKLNLTTNGTFPRKGVETWAKIIIPVTSDVKISWNGASKYVQEKIMLGSRWEKVLNNLKKFISIRNSYAEKGENYCQVTLQMTFLESNIHELASIVKLGIDMGVDRIKGHHLWAHFEEIKSLSMRRNPESISRWNQEVIRAQKVAKSHLLSNGQYIKLVNFNLLDESAQHDLAPDGVCPFLGQEAWVATDGRFNPCCAPDKERRQLGYFGNLKNKTLNEIWASKAYQHLNKNYLQYDLCKGCNMKKHANFN